jgi:NodT family efflux transporter outer membrane factor (OMF) lipoprotein
MPHPYFPPYAALGLRGIASMCVLALSISGCAPFSEIGPRAEPKDISSYQTGHLLAGNAVNWPDDNWWTIYGDRQLDALIAEGLKGAPSLAAAQARLLKAQGVAQQQGAALLPQVSANASADYMKQSYNNGVPPEFVPQNYNVEGKATLNLSYEIDFWGKNRAALAAATSDLEAARADAAQARIALATSIAAAYAEFERLLSQHDTTQEALQVRIQTLDLFEQRRLNGLETLGSVKQVLARKASAEADLLSLDESIGLSLQRPVLDLSKPFSLPSQLPVNLLGRRPDVVAARLRAEAAAKQIKVAKAQFYPNVNLTAYLGFQSLGLGMLTKAGSDIGSIGPAISLPIFEGGRLRGQYRQASGSYDEAVANYDGAVTQALQDVADAAVSGKALSGRLGKVQEAVDAAAAAARIAQNRYAGGLATYLDVLNAQDTLLTNQRDLSTLRSRMFALDVELVRALGGGYRQAAI